MPTIRHILVPTDFSDCAAQALDYALEFGAKLDARVTLLHVVEIPTYSYSAAAYLAGDFSKIIEDSARKQLDASVAELKKRAPTAEGQLLLGPPGEMIRVAIKDVKPDLVVMGTHGRRGLMHAMLGSVAEKTVRLATVPVLVVHASKAAAQ